MDLCRGVVSDKSIREDGFTFAMSMTVQWYAFSSKIHTTTTNLQGIRTVVILVCVLSPVYLLLSFRPLEGVM